MNPEICKMVEQRNELEELKSKVREYFTIYENKDKIPGWVHRVMKVKSELRNMALPDGPEETAN